MSHTLVVSPDSATRWVQLTIVNYTTGGEAVTVSELNVSAVDQFIFGSVPPSSNSLGVVLFPIFIAGKIMLFEFVSGSPVQIPATSALNAVITVLVHISGF